MPDQSGPPDSVGILVPTGMLGGGFGPETITRGISLGADVIAVDGGSTDSGPYYLGPAWPRRPSTPCVATSACSSQPRAAPAYR